MLKTLKEYYRLVKPGIIYGNLLTAAAGFFLAARFHLDILLFLAMLLGVSCIIGSACVFNNVIDRKIDSRMQRTRSRPTVTGAISKRNALIYGAVLGIIGILVLLLYVNFLALIVALAAGVLYVGLYTPMKTRSAYSALIGSVPGAAPPVIGYVALTGHLDFCALLLFLILCFWQMAHFYAIAIYRIEDYREAGVPVFSIQKGVRYTKVQIIWFIIAFIAATIALNVFKYVGTGYLIGMLILGSGWLVLGLQGLDKKTEDQRWARGVFLFSLIVITVFSVLISLNPR